MPNNKNLKAERIAEKQKLKSLITESKRKHNEDMVKVDTEIKNAKLKEAKIKSKIRIQKQEQKQEIVKIKGTNKQIVTEHKQILVAKKKESILANGVSKKEVELVRDDMRNKKLSLQKVNSEKKASIKADQYIENEKIKEARRSFKQEQAEKKLKFDLDASEKKLKIMDIKLERSKKISEEKELIQREKMELKQLKEQKRIEFAKIRREKLIIARQERIDINLSKAIAKNKHVEEIARLKEEKSKYKKELFNIERMNQNEISELDIETSAKETEIEINAYEEIEASKTVKEPEVTKENDFKVEYENVFIEEIDDDEIKVQEDIVSSYVINTFGKKAVNRFNRAQEDSIESDISRYKNKYLFVESINKFREYIKTDVVDIKSLGLYVCVELNKEVTEERIKSVQAHAITALLEGHSIKFGDGFLISSKVSGKTMISFMETIDVEAIEIVSEKFDKQLNKLIKDKLDLGTKLLLANGLMISREDGKTNVYEDTNFIKA